MPSEFCFTLPDGRKRCFPLLLDLRHLLFVDPNPPDPPFDRDILTLQTLATIHGLAERIGDVGADIRDMTSERMQEMARSMGASIETSQPKARMTSTAA